MPPRAVPQHRPGGRAGPQAPGTPQTAPGDPIPVASPWASTTAGAGGGSGTGRRGNQDSFPRRGKAPGANLGIPKAASARPALVPAFSCEELLL